MTEKEYRIQFTHEKDHLYVLVSGDRVNVGIARQYWQDIDDERRKNNWNKILIEDRVEGRLTFAEYHEMGLAIADMGFRGCKVAYVDRNIGLDRNVLNAVLHAQTVLTNRGMTGKVFDNVDDARKWLSGPQG